MLLQILYPTNQSLLTSHNSFAYLHEAPSAGPCAAYWHRLRWQHFPTRSIFFFLSAETPRYTLSGTGFSPATKGENQENLPINPSGAKLQKVFWGRKAAVFGLLLCRSPGWLAGWLAGWVWYIPLQTNRPSVYMLLEGNPEQKVGGSFLHTRMCCIVCWTVKKEYTRDTRFPVCHRCSRNFGCVCVCVCVVLFVAATICVPKENKTLDSFRYAIVRYRWYCTLVFRNTR